MGQHSVMRRGGRGKRSGMIGRRRRKRRKSCVGWRWQGRGRAEEWEAVWWEMVLVLLRGPLFQRMLTIRMRSTHHNQARWWALRC